MTQRLASWLAPRMLGASGRRSRGGPTLSTDLRTIPHPRGRGVVRCCIHLPTDPNWWMWIQLVTLRAITGMDHFRHVSASVGDQPMLSRGGGPTVPVEAASAANLGEVTVELAPAETRVYTSEQLGLMWREANDPIREVNFDMSIMNPGDDVDVQLVGSDLDRLRAAAEEVQRRLAAYAGVYEISDSFRADKVEMQLGIKPAAETLGLTLQDLGRQVRQAFYGEDAQRIQRGPRTVYISTRAMAFYGEEAQRIQRGRDNIRVMVRYPRDRRSLGDLENMRIRTPNGAEVPFSQVAQVKPGRGFASIERVDRKPMAVSLASGCCSRPSSR